MAGSTPALGGVVPGAAGALQAPRESHLDHLSHWVLMRLREVLDALEWKEGIPLGELEFLVVDRQAEGGERLLSGGQVTGRDRSWLHLSEGGQLPYHRVLEVRTAGRVVWKRRDREAP